MKKKILYALAVLLLLIPAAVLFMAFPQRDERFWIMLISSEISLLAAEAVTLWALGDKPGVYHGTVALYGWVYFVLAATVNYQCGYRMALDPLALIIVHFVTLTLCLSIMLTMTASARKINAQRKAAQGDTTGV